MSLILEALKRAERERRAGQTPTPLDAVAAPLPETPAAGARRWLLPALVGAVVAGGAVYLWITLRSTPAVAPAAAPVSVAAPVAATAPTPQPQPAPPVATETTTAEDAAPPPSARRSADNGPATLDDLVDDKAGSGQGARAASGNPSANDSTSTASNGKPRVGNDPARGTSPPDQLPPFEQPVGPPSAELPSPPPTPTPSLPAAPAPTQSTVAPAAEADTAVTTQAGAAAAPARSFKEMSPNYRAEFPTLSIDVHVYDVNPQSRFVILNGKRYHEGETIADGPRIVGITADGIVFDYRGERVLYGLSR